MSNLCLMVFRNRTRSHYGGRTRRQVPRRRASHATARRGRACRPLCAVHQRCRTCAHLLRRRRSCRPQGLCSRPRVGLAAQNRTEEGEAGILPARRSCTQRTRRGKAVESTRGPRKCAPTARLHRPVAFHAAPRRRPAPPAAMLRRGCADGHTRQPPEKQVLCSVHSATKHTGLAGQRSCAKPWMHSRWSPLSPARS